MNIQPTNLAKPLSTAGKPPIKKPVKPLPDPKPLPGATPYLRDAIEFKGLDRNHDSQLSLSEFTGRRLAPPTKDEQARFDRFDRDGDKQVSFDEFKAGRFFERLGIIRR